MTLNPRHLFLNMTASHYWDFFFTIIRWLIHFPMSVFTRPKFHQKKIFSATLKKSWNKNICGNINTVHTHTFQKCSLKDLWLMLLFPSIFFSLQPSRIFTGMFKTGIKTQQLHVGNTIVHNNDVKERNEYTCYFFHPLPLSFPPWSFCTNHKFQGILLNLIWICICSFAGGRLEGI